MPVAAIANQFTHACLGIQALGSCAYNPSAPAVVYFSLGEAVTALGFTLAVQQLLKPIYVFRLNARYISLREVYGLVFLGALAALVAALLPNFPRLQSGPLGFPILWEIAGALFCVAAYGAVVIAIISPVRVKAKNTIQFVRASAYLLSQANDQDHVDYSFDLARSLPELIKMSAFVGDLFGPTSAFFDFIHRKELERASYADSLLRIIADPPFCATLVKKCPWQVARLLQELEQKRLHSRGAEQFVRELARQAILADDSMMEREIGYHGFGTVSLLSNSLFSQPFVLRAYDPLGSFRFMGSGHVTAAVLKRFNSAAEKALAASPSFPQTPYAQARYRTKPRKILWLTQSWACSARKSCRHRQ
jgi:hypothetical protein